MVCGVNVMCHLMEAITRKLVDLSNKAIEVDDPSKRSEVFNQIIMLSSVIGEGAERARGEVLAKKVPMFPSLETNELQNCPIPVTNMLLRTY